MTQIAKDLGASDATLFEWLKKADVEDAKAKPNTLIHQPTWRIRTDVVDVRGHVTLRYVGKLRHLDVGWGYRDQRIRLYILDGVVTFATDDDEFIARRRSTPTATTSQRVTAPYNVHRFSCSRCPDRFSKTERHR